MKRQKAESVAIDALATIVVVALFIGGIIAIAWRSEAQGAERESPCPTHSQMSAYLTEHFGEKLVGGGTASEGVVIEFYLAPSGSWTLTITRAGQGTCIFAGGYGWQVGSPLLPGQKDT